MSSANEEMGIKEVGSDLQITAKAAVQFATMGINILSSIPAATVDKANGKATVPLSESKFIGKICAGNLLFAQGLELILKLILLTENISEKGLGQHKLLVRYKRIRALDPVAKNLQQFMPVKCANKIESARQVVEMAENAFLTSRYIGLKKADLHSIDPVDAAGLLLALCLSYKGMEQFEVMDAIGLKVKNSDGSPTIHNNFELEAKVKEFNAQDNKTKVR